MGIKKFSKERFLCTSTSAGGIILWLRKGSGISVWTWPGLLLREDWISSERAWVLIEDRETKIGSCFVYLRVELPKSSLFFKQNDTLLSQIGLELTHLRTLGFKICVQGDFNTHVGISKNFTFLQYPHPMNNNGCVLSEFVILNNIYCMNPMRWKGNRSNDFTFQRDMGGRLLWSIVDYGLASPEAFDTTISFSVKDSIGMRLSQITAPYSGLLQWDLPPHSQSHLSQKGNQ